MKKNILICIFAAFLFTLVFSSSVNAYSSAVCGDCIGEDTFCTIEEMITILAEETACMIKPKCDDCWWVHEGLTGHMDECDNTNGGKCKENACPDTDLFNGEICWVVAGCTYWNILELKYTPELLRQVGKWDAFEKKCVQCSDGGSGKLEEKICGDKDSIRNFFTEKGNCMDSVCGEGTESEFYSSCASGDGQCESACGADAACDEVSDGGNCTAGLACSDGTCTGDEPCNNCICKMGEEPPSCSGTLSVDITGTGTCSATADITFTEPCRGQSLAYIIKESTTEKCSGNITIPVGTGTYLKDNICGWENISQGPHTYTLYIDTIEQNSATGNCPPAGCECTPWDCTDDGCGIYPCPEDKMHQTCNRTCTGCPPGTLTTKTDCVADPVCQTDCENCSDTFITTDGDYSGDGDYHCGRLAATTSINRCCSGTSKYYRVYCSDTYTNQVCTGVQSTPINDCKDECCQILLGTGLAYCSGGVCMKDTCGDGDVGRYESCDPPASSSTQCPCSSGCDGYKYKECSSFYGTCTSSCDCEYDYRVAQCADADSTDGVMESYNCNAPCDQDSDCDYLTCNPGDLKICNQETCQCECRTCDVSYCEVKNIICPSSVEAGQDFVITFESYTGKSPASNTRKLESPWDTEYTSSDTPLPCDTVTDEVTLTAPTAPGTYEYEAWCDYSYKTCSIEVIDTTPPEPLSINVSVPQCFCPSGDCVSCANGCQDSEGCHTNGCCTSPKECTSEADYRVKCRDCKDFPKVYWTTGADDVQRFDVCYIEGNDYDDCLAKAAIAEIPGAEDRCFENSETSSGGVWSEAAITLGAQESSWDFNPIYIDTLDEFTTNHVYIFQVRVKDISGNVGWNSVYPGMKVVNECSTPESTGFYQEGSKIDVPSTLDLAADQTIFLDVPQGGTVTAAPIKLTGGSDAPKDLTIKVGGTAEQNYADGKDVYKYSGKFAYEYKGTYGVTPTRYSSGNQNGYYTKTGTFTASNQELKTTKTVDFTHSLQKILTDGCPTCESSGDYWFVPINVISQSAGKITLSNFQLNGGGCSGSKTIEFTEAGSDSSAKIKVPKSTPITSAEIYIKGDISNASYPLSPILDIGNDGSPEAMFGYTEVEIIVDGAQEFKTHTYVDFTDSLQKLLDEGCPTCQDKGDYWLIPIKVSSFSAGKITLSDLKIYDTTFSVLAQNFPSGEFYELIEFAELGFDTSVKMEIPKSASIFSAKIYLQGGDIFGLGPYPLSPTLDIGNDGLPEWKFGDAKIIQDLIKPVLKIKPKTDIQGQVVWLNGNKYKFKDEEINAVSNPSFETSEGWVFDTQTPERYHGSRHYCYIYDIEDDASVTSSNEWRTAGSRSIKLELKGVNRDGFCAEGYAVTKTLVDFSKVKAMIFDAKWTYLSDTTLKIIANGREKWSYTGWYGDISGKRIDLSDVEGVGWLELRLDGYEGTGYFDNLRFVSSTNEFDISDTLKLGSHNVFNFLSSGNLDWEIFDFKKETFNPGGILKDAKIRFKDIKASNPSVTIDGTKYIGGNEFDLPDMEAQDYNLVFGADTSEGFKWEIVGNQYSAEPDASVDIQVNGEISNPKITFVGEGLEVEDIKNMGTAITCHAMMSCSGHYPPEIYICYEGEHDGAGIAFWKRIFEGIPEGEYIYDTMKWEAYGGIHCRVYDAPWYVTGRYSIANSTHKGYIKQSWIWEDNVQIVKAGLYNFYINEEYIIGREAPYNCDDYEGGVYFTFNPDILNSQEYVPVKFEIFPGRASARGVGVVGGEYNDIHLKYTLAVPTRNPKLTIDGQSQGIPDGELKDGVAGSKSITLNQGINNLDFSSLGPGNVLESPHEITNSVGSGKFNWKITGDLSRTIDLASEINEYVHNNCASIDCKVPITFSGTGSEIGFVGNASVITEPLCNPFGVPPIADSLSSRPGCIWPLVALTWEFVDDADDGMSAYQVEIWDNYDFSGNKLMDSGKISINPDGYLSGSTFTYEVENLPISSTGKYYWKVKVWDRDNIESGWADGQDTGIKLL